MFVRGTLRETIRRATRRALAAGALRPIPTEFEFIEDRGVRFLVRVVANLARKQHARVESGDASRRKNPFLPYDQDMYVADASPSHVCLLNKFNVVDEHLLIVTRDFEHQQTPLTEADFEALGRCMAEFDSLGFYNSGTIAGASQTHKHLQLVPLPLAPSGPRIPLEPLIVAARLDAGIGRISGLEFQHAAARLDLNPSVSPDRTARSLLAAYGRLMRAVGIADRMETRQRIDRPYNLLVTCHWMLLVPRRRERFASISLNALAFAGALLVRDEQQMQALKQHGPMAALRHVACEPDPRF